MMITLTLQHLKENDNIIFLENLEQGLKRTISLNKYRSKIKTQPKSNSSLHGWSSIYEY